LHPEGHTLAGVPYLSFEESGCTFCGDCVERCPATTGDEPLPARIGLAHVDRDACVVWDGVVCMSCRWACPHEAVAMDRDGRPDIDTGACNGCGFCVPVCPTDAIHVSW
jgi:ferredoxin-type protein NapF